MPFPMLWALGGLRGPMDPALTMSSLRFMRDVIDYLESVKLTPGKLTTPGYCPTEAIS